MRLDIPVSRGLSPCRIAAVGALGGFILLAGCQPEQRPTAGSVKTIGSPTTKSVSGTTGSVSGVTGAAPTTKSAASPAASPIASASPAAKVSPAASPAASPSPAALPPSKSDGIYTPVSNREIYQKIASDYQVIAALTNQVAEGKPLPSADILKVYEEAQVARIGTQSRPLRGFAREEARAQEFPEAAAFYGTPTFLDTPVIDAINGTGSAAGYTPAQRQQAIQKGIQRILYYWSSRYLIQARGSLNPGVVDEAWAIYVGEEVDGKYPNSLAATAVSREGNFNRPGSIDVPLRQALSRAQKAAADKDATAFATAEREVGSRFNAIFYLGAARYLNESVKSVQGGNAAAAGVQQIEGLGFYQAIQPTVAKASVEADRAVTSFYQSDPAKLTTADRDRALAALNQAADALGLQPGDRVSPADYK